MILQTQASNTIQTSGSLESKKATINADKLGKLQYMLTTGLYTDSIGSTLVELSNNAIDSIRMSGKDPIEYPCIVRIYSEGGHHTLSVKDTGLGLDKEEFENVVMNYLTSTKEQDDQAIGHFGVGAKSFLSLERPAEWICRKNGKEWKFLAYKGPEFLEYDELYEKDTTEENGVEVRIKIKDSWEKGTFINKAKQRLAYYDEIALVIDNTVFDNKIYRNDLFQWCGATPYSEMHFTLKDVVYKIDWNQLAIPSINVPIALRFDLSCGITPTISRESVHYTDVTKTILFAKIKEVADYMVGEYNKTTHKQTFFEAYSAGINLIDKYLKIEGKDFHLNNIAKYSSSKLNGLSVEGINTIDLKKVDQKKSELFYSYEQVGYLRDNGTWKKEKIYRETSLSTWVLRNKRTVLLDQTPIGNVKSFLQSKYPSDTMFVVKNRERILQKTKGYISDASYYSLLDLHKVPKKDWRGWIKDWQAIEKEFTDKFIKEFAIESSQAYQQWLQEKKDKQKALRNSPAYISKALNKQKGEVTIKVAGIYRGKLKWDTYTSKIEDLYKQKLTVYITRTEEQDRYLYEYKQALKTVRFIQVNVSELKHFQNRHNYITMKELKDSRPFQRLATALHAEDILALEPDNDKVIYETFPKYKKLKQKVETYIGDNNQYSIDGTMKNFILEEVKATQDWDQNIYPEVQQLKDVMNKFSFLNFLDAKNAVSEEAQAVIKNITYIMLKNKLKTGKNIDEFQLVPKDDLCLSTVSDVITEELVPF